MQPLTLGSKYLEENTTNYEHLTSNLRRWELIRIVANNS